MAQIRDSEEKLQLQTKEINTSFFTTDRAVGGPSGGDFFVGVKKGTDVPVTSTATVRSLKAWYDSNSLRGIQVRLTDGTVTLVGEKSSDKETDEFYFADGEKVASLKIWYNKFFDGRCGKVELVTTQQNRRFIIDAKTTSNDYYEPEIGSGILFGVFGTSGSDIDSLGFALLRRVQSAVLTNVSYPEISTLLITTKPREIKSITYDNTEGTVEQSFTFSGSQSVEESETWSVTAGIESSVETEVKAGVPLLAEGKVTVSVTVSVEGTYERSTTKTSEQAFEFPINVPPGKRVLATATMYEGVIDTKYNATIYYTLDSDVSFNFEIKDGTYKGIQASQAVVSVEEYTDSFFDRPVFSSSQTIVHP